MKWLLLLMSFPAYGVGLEQGQSNSFMANPKYYTESKYSAVTQRWGYTEAILGSWYGESHGRFAGLSGVYQSPGQTFYDVSLGVVRLIDYQGDQLDGDYQFNLSLGIGRRFDDLEVSVKFRHFSNGNSSGKNWGQEFKLFCLRHEF